MTDKQPDALRLADEADTADLAGYQTAKKANAYCLCLLEDCAQMIRRLHAENETLRSGYAAAPTTQPAPQQGTPLMPKGDSAAPKLRAMATNYPAGHLWDKLDAQACIRGALEIESLKARPAGGACPQCRGSD